MDDSNTQPTDGVIEESYETFSKDDPDADAKIEEHRAKLLEALQTAESVFAVWFEGDETCCAAFGNSPQELSFHANIAATKYMQETGALGNLLGAVEIDDDDQIVL